AMHVSGCGKRFGSSGSFLLLKAACSLAVGAMGRPARWAHPKPPVKRLRATASVRRPSMDHPRSRLKELGNCKLRSEERAERSITAASRFLHLSGSQFAVCPGAVLGVLELADEAGRRLDHEVAGQLDR